MMVELDNSEDLYKCIRFDLHDPSAQYVLFKRSSSWKYKPMFHDSEEVKDFYKKVKSFSSKSELDIWCATADIEYEFTDSVLIEDESSDR